MCEKRCHGLALWREFLRRSSKKNHRWREGPLTDSLLSFDLLSRAFTLPAKSAFKRKKNIAFRYPPIKWASRP
jgi:hypothetical protein